MSIVDRLRVRLARGMLKAMNLTLTPEWARHAFMAPTFDALTREGYKGNAAVFACISQLVMGYIEPRLMVWRQTDGGSVPLPNHPLSLLFRHPNKQMGIGELLQFTQTYKAIGGNCYWYKVRSAARRVVELIPLNDAQITPVAGGSSLVDHYEFENGTGRPNIIPADDIVQFKWMIDPLQPWRGLAPLMAVAREVDSDNEATKYLFALLKNDAVPRLALVAPAGTVLSDDQITRMRSEWKDRYGGANRGAPAILEGGLDVRTISLNLQELAFEALHRIPEARIAAAFRVPAVLAGLNVGLEQMTYNNVDGMMEHFTKRTLVPQWRLDEEEMTADLLPEFGGRDDEIVAFDMGSVDALAEDVDKKRTWVDGAIGHGYMTVNEGRAQIGLAKDPAGAIYLRSMVSIEVPLGGERPEPAPVADAPNPLKAYRVKGARDRRAAQRALITAQRQTRAEVGRRMESAVDAYFARLAELVVNRAGKAWQVWIERKDLPAAEDLLNAADRAELEAVVKRSYIEIIQASWQYFNTALGIEVAFDLADPVVTAILETCGKRVKNINDTTLQALRDLLQHGSEEGWSIQHILRGDPENNIPGLKQLVEETYKGRAKTIARTELGNAQNGAAVGRYKAVGVTKVFVMDNGLDDDDEPCKLVNGTVQTIEWAEHNPLEHPNCVIGSTQVLARDVLAAYSREFHGEVVVLRTAANHTLTVTANHPILTDHGWVAAGSLKQGDYVVCGSDSESVSRFFNPDDHNVPATIQEIADALRKASGVTTAVVPGAAEDFHGDGADGEVEVIDAHGLLGNAGDATLGEKRGQLSFERTVELAGLVLPRHGAGYQIGLDSLDAADGIMGGCGVGGSLLGGAPGSGERLGCAGIKDGQATGVEAVAESAIANADLMGKGHDALPCQVTLVQAGVVPIGSEVEASLGEGGAQLLGTESDTLCNILGAFASETALVQLVEVERPAAYFGHVYNLSTREGWYLANGIVTHNCTRAFAPEFD